MNFPLLRKPFAALLIIFLSLGLARADAIHELIKDGLHKEAIKLLSTNAALIEAVDTNHCTPLHIAAQHNQPEVVKWLLHHKAKVNARAYNDYTPLFLTKDGDIAHMLVRGGADLSLRDDWGKTALQHAAQLQHKEAYTNIIEAGGSLDLESALFMGDREAAKKLIHRKPEQIKEPFPQSDLYGNTTPLGIAAGNGDDEIVTLLLKAGAPVNAITDRPGSSSMTALCNAVWGGHYSTAEILCNAGADCNVTGGRGLITIVDFAKKHSDQHMVDLLQAHGGHAQNVDD